MFWVMVRAVINYIGEHRIKGFPDGRIITDFFILLLTNRVWSIYYHYTDFSWNQNMDKVMAELC
jgi:hypothetical protein